MLPPTVETHRRPPRRFKQVVSDIRRAEQKRDYIERNPMNTIVQCVRSSPNTRCARASRDPPSPPTKIRIAECRVGRGNDYRDKYPKPRDEPVELTPNARARSLHLFVPPQANTQQIHYANRGFAHTEGGWPKDVDPWCAEWSPSAP